MAPRISPLWWPALREAGGLATEALVAGQYDWRSHHALAPGANAELGPVLLAIFGGLVALVGLLLLRPDPTAPRSDRERPALAALAMALLLATPLSAPLWRLLGPMEMLQFPWRFLGPATILGVVLAAGWRGRRRLMALLLLVGPTALVPVELDSGFPALRPELGGAELARSCAIRYGLAPVLPALPGFSAPGFHPLESLRELDSREAAVEALREGPLPRVYRVTSARRAPVLLPLQWWPDLELLRDNETLAHTNAGGLVEVMVPAGSTVIRARLDPSRARREGGLMLLAGALLLGALLGHAGFGLFTENLLATISPVVLLGLAWVGLIVGLQFDLRVLGSLQPWHRRAGFLLPLGVGVVVGAVAFALGARGATLVLLSSVAMVTTPRVVDHLSRSQPPADRSAMRLIKLVAALSSVPALLTWGVGITLVSEPHFRVAFLPGQAATLILAAGLAVILGYATMILLRGETESVHILALLVGVVALIAGAGELTGAEPMLMAALTGALIANRSPNPHRILRAAHGLEVPMLTAILLLVGAWWHPGGFSLLALAALVVVRGVLLLVAGRILTGQARRREVPLSVRWLGLGLAPHGPLALAFLVAATRENSVTASVAAGVFASLVLNHVTGSRWLRLVLYRQRSGAPEERP